MVSYVLYGVVLLLLLVLLMVTGISCTKRDTEQRRTQDVRGPGAPCPLPPHPESASETESLTVFVLLFSGLMLIFLLSKCRVWAET